MAKHNATLSLSKIDTKETEATFTFLISYVDENTNLEVDRWTLPVTVEESLIDDSLKLRPTAYDEAFDLLKRRLTFVGQKIEEVLSRQ